MVQPSQAAIEMRRKMLQGYIVIGEEIHGPDKGQPLYCTKVKGINKCGKCDKRLAGYYGVFTMPFWKWNNLRCLPCADRRHYNKLPIE